MITLALLKDLKMNTASNDIKREIDLKGIPETMLWTLHNRATEAKRHDTYLKDPECIKIYDAINYDYEKKFGKANDSHPMRSKIFDRALLKWMEKHPSGRVIELGSGLETQFQRCDNGTVHWYCVDVPESIQVRKIFLQETERCRYITKSALDFSWMDEINAENVFITAQGLFMYFKEDEVKALFVKIISKYANVEIIFDAIPRWFSKKSLKGFGKTKNYTAPPMPWGVNRNEIEPLLKKWSDRIRSVETQLFGFYHGISGTLLRTGVLSHFPIIKNIGPTITHVKI